MELLRDKGKLFELHQKFLHEIFGVYPCPAPSQPSLSSSTTNNNKRHTFVRARTQLAAVESRGDKTGSQQFHN
jgi:hypothetical protein